MAIEGIGSQFSKLLACSTTPVTEFPEQTNVREIILHPIALHILKFLFLGRLVGF